MMDAARRATVAGEEVRGVHRRGEILPRCRRGSSSPAGTAQGVLFLFPGPDAPRGHGAVLRVPEPLMPENAARWALMSLMILCSSRPVVLHGMALLPLPCTERPVPAR